MTRKKEFLYALAVMTVIVGLLTIVERFFFPDGFPVNDMLRSIITGAIGGGSYAFVVFWNQRKK